MEVPQARWMVCKGKSQSKMDDLGVPPIYGNPQIESIWDLCGCFMVPSEPWDSW